LNALEQEVVRLLKHSYIKPDDYPALYVWVQQAIRDLESA